MARLPHRRIPYDKTTAWFATSSLDSFGDTALQGTHRLIQRRHGELAKGVRSAMPPRYLAFEEVDVRLQIPKLDPSAPNFIQSRTLVRRRPPHQMQCRAAVRCWGGNHGATANGRRVPRRDSYTAASYSITSSARFSSDGGTVIPSVLAHLRFITSSYLVGACTGRSDGFSPLRMRST